MIDYKDFGRLPGLGENSFSSFPASAQLAAIRQWVASENIEVINIETLSYSAQGRYVEAVRVWHRGPKE